MFDIGFWELGIIGVVALVVIGPERLPGVARSIGRWVGGAQRFVSSVKADIDKEISKNEDLKGLIEEQKELRETHEILEKTVSDLSTPTSVPSGAMSASTPKVKAVADNSASDSPAPSTDSEKSGVEDK